MCFFFFSSRRRHTRFKCDWSSDVCSSDLSAWEGFASMDLGIVKMVGIVEEMTGAYLDYSMSVIVSGALPDVRDGLKPVHRRVLYAMEQMGLQSNRSFRKCAGIVGEVLKEYHPHSDAAVYDTLVRLTQPWNLRYPLALGQGNFGCFTGDTTIALLDGTEKT